MKKIFVNAFGLAKKHSPEILMAVGAVGVISAAVMACKATPKAAEVKEELEVKVNELHENKESETYKKDLATTYGEAALGFAKAYGPAVAVGAVSLSAMIGSNYILKKRNAMLLTAYTTVSNGYKLYRERVIAKYGKEEDFNLRHNVKTETVEETYIDEKGKEKTRKKKVTSAELSDCSPYARFFDASSRCWEKDPETNMLYLKSCQNQATDKLRADKVLFLNDVYRMLDIPITKEGWKVGWVYDADETLSDNFVDFGIHELCNARAVNCMEDVFLLDFNVVDIQKYW